MSEKQWRIDILTNQIICSVINSVKLFYGTLAETGIVSNSASMIC